MPYIDKTRRAELEHPRNEPDVSYPTTPGELTFALTDAIEDYLDTKDGARFGDYAEILGALEACKLEFYRRVIAPYEDGKLYENGDVYSIPR